jgi:peroxiredoxin
MTQLNVGDRVGRHDLVTIHGKPARLPDPEHLVHLQFRRYAGCPVCNLHLRTIAARHDEILAAGVREVVVFYSEAETMLGFQGALPFATIADPEKKLYAEFGVGTMRYTGAFKPRSWRAAARGLANAPSLRGIGSKGTSYLGLPADFLIDTDGTVLAANYGKFTDDHWPVDQLLALARGERTSR